jgi:phospholipase C
VCSQVFDHTSVLQLLERVCKVRETNISAWRRTVCGDLTTAFRPFRAGEGVEETLPYPKREEVLEQIHKAQYQPLPEAWKDPAPTMPKQEPGARKSLALPYELSAEATVQNGALALLLVAGNKRFGRRAAGGAFHVYTPGLYRESTEFRTRAYAVEPGAALHDSWALDGFPNSRYDLCVCGPNGFFRHFRGAVKAGSEPKIQIQCDDLGDSVAIRVTANGKYTVRVRDVSYGSAASRTLTARRTVFPLQKSNRWYDFEVTVDEAPGYLRRYAGRVENGAHSVSDPAMA